MEYAQLIWAEQDSGAKKRKGADGEVFVDELRVSSLLQELGSMGTGHEDIFHMEVWRFI